MEKKQKSLLILISILIGIGIGVLAWNIFTPNLAKGVFYYLLDNKNADLFLLSGNNDPEKIISISAREVDFGKYKLPRHSYVSNNGKQMIYFKQIDEIPVEGNEDIVISRVVYDPVLINLKTGKEKTIEQPIDSSGVVFSSDNTQIAWIKEIQGVTFQDIEDGGKKRELWISRADGENANLLTSFDENLILLQKWDNNYIYFQGLWDANIRSLGRVNVKTRRIERLVPNHCNDYLENCKNILLSNSGRFFLYEIQNNDVTELYLGDFDKREFAKVLTTDRISDKLWVSNEKEFFYTEQERTRKEGVKETIHLVDIKNQTDDKIYTGSYISQLSLNGNYLFFLEKQVDGDNFKLIRLNIKTKQAQEILITDYNNVLLIQ